MTTIIYCPRPLGPSGEIWLIFLYVRCVEVAICKFEKRLGLCFCMKIYIKAVIVKCPLSYLYVDNVQELGNILMNVWLECMDVFTLWNCCAWLPFRGKKILCLIRIIVMYDQEYCIYKVVSRQAYMCQCGGWIVMCIVQNNIITAESLDDPNLC